MSYRIFFTFSVLLTAIALLPACAPQPPQPSPGHLNTDDITRPAEDDIPPLIGDTAFLLPPVSAPPPPENTYTVVVDSVPVNELLFALSRDVDDYNMDIYPGIPEQNVMLNAIDQTLPQILERLARQVALRYEFDGNSISIGPDLPHIRTYKVDYVNLSRSSETQFLANTQVSSSVSEDSGGKSSIRGDENNSSISITNTSSNNFWETLTSNLRLILNEADGQNNVVINQTSGVISVRATDRQHREIQQFLDEVLKSVQKQVLIEATIAEVRLNDKYQAGIDWQRVSGDFSYIQSTIAKFTETPVYSFAYSNPDSRYGNISATLKLLDQFGTTRVLSSPRLMVLNNQTAVLRVVDNRVYFEFDVQQRDSTQNSAGSTTIESRIRTVPEGLVMNVTPQISNNDIVTLNVRPTITRIIGFVNDPNPILINASTNGNVIANRVPEVQVREVESILKVRNGDVAVIGGLMQDNSNQSRDGIPVLSRLPGIGDAFSYRSEEFKKTELVIFMRPVVIDDASLNGDLRDYQRYLPRPEADPSPPTGPLDILPSRPSPTTSDPVSNEP